jgi:hypothetical protein
LACALGVSPRAWAYVAGGTLCILLGAATLLLARHQVARIAFAVSILGIAFAGLVQTTSVDAKLGPSGSGTYGRTTEEWGAFLSPALIELREDALRRYEGRQTEPGRAAIRPRADPGLVLGAWAGRLALPARGGRCSLFAAGLAAVRSIVRRT